MYVLAAKRASGASHTRRCSSSCEGARRHASARQRGDARQQTTQEIAHTSEQDQRGAGLKGGRGNGPRRDQLRAIVIREEATGASLRAEQAAVRARRPLVRRGRVGPPCYRPRRLRWRGNVLMAATQVTRQRRWAAESAASSSWVSEEERGGRRGAGNDSGRAHRRRSRAGRSRGGGARGDKKMRRTLHCERGSKILID
jgi:hypothetical protein